MTRKTLAERSRVALSSVALLEEGRLNPTLETLQKVARVLRVRVADLLEDEAPAPTPTLTTKVFGRIVSRLSERQAPYLLNVEKLLVAFDRAVEVEAQAEKSR
jgi:transcriptional regulator with XRE-family HTH domain